MAKNPFRLLFSLKELKHMKIVQDYFLHPQYATIAEWGTNKPDSGVFSPKNSFF